MSKIIIICTKGFEKNQKNGSLEKAEYENQIEINVSQWFMNTEKFFLSVKQTLEKYFDSIEKKG